MPFLVPTSSVFLRTWVPFFIAALFLGACCNPFRSKELSLDVDAFPDGQVGVPYAAVAHFTNADTPVGEVVAAEGLPPGLALDWKKHERMFSIAGMPTVAGAHPFRLRGYSYGTMCAGKYFDRPFVLRVAPAAR